MLQEMNTAYVLASASPRRKELLSYLQFKHVYQFVIETDETIAASWTPAEAVMRLSVNKAFAVFNDLASLPDQLPHEVEKLSIIAADTIVVLDQHILGKPKDVQDAFMMLKSLQGRSHQVYTGLSLLSATNKNVIAKHGLSLTQTLHMKKTIEGSFTDISGYEAYGRIGRSKRFMFQPDIDCIIQTGYIRSHVTFRPLTDQQIWSYIKTGDPLDKAGSYGIQGIGAVNIESIDGDFYSVMGLPLSMLHAFVHQSQSDNITI